MGDDKLPESYQARLDELKVEYDRDGDAVFDRLVDDPIMYLLLLQRVNPEEAAKVIEDGLIDAGLTNADAYELIEKLERMRKH
jgi:hypothetical protein